MLDVENFLRDFWPVMRDDMGPPPRPFSERDDGTVIVSKTLHHNSNRINQLRVVLRHSTIGTTPLPAHLLTSHNEQYVSFIAKKGLKLSIIVHLHITTDVYYLNDNVSTVFVLVLRLLVPTVQTKCDVKSA